MIATRPPKPEERRAFETWRDAVVDEFRALCGAVVRSVHGIERAVAGTGFDEPPVFNHPSVPCRQFLRLVLVLDDNSAALVTTYQEGTSWGLFLDRIGSSVELASRTSGGLSPSYRASAVPEVPLGAIAGVQVYLDAAGNVGEVLLETAGGAFALVAGEVYETTSGLHVDFGDESVLLFVNLARLRCLRELAT